MNPTGNVNVTVAHLNMWKAMFPNMEMNARHLKPLFPPVQVNATGLDATKKYEVGISIDRFDNIRYCVTGGKWVTSQKRKVTSVKTTRKIIKLSLKTGEELMSEPIDFSHIKLTNEPKTAETNKNAILTVPLHKYIPTIHIVSEDAFECYSFPLHIAQFFPVTGYQRDEMKKWKCANNKFVPKCYGGNGKVELKDDEATDLLAEKMPSFQMPSQTPLTDDQKILQQQPIYSFNPPTSNPPQEAAHQQSANPVNPVNPAVSTDMYNKFGGDLSWDNQFDNYQNFYQNQNYQFGGQSYFNAHSQNDCFNYSGQQDFNSYNYNYQFGGHQQSYSQNFNQQMQPQFQQQPMNYQYQQNQYTHSSSFSDNSSNDSYQFSSSEVSPFSNNNTSPTTSTQTFPPANSF